MIILKNYEELSLWGAEYIAGRILKAPEKKSFVLGLPTGSTPLGIYRELIRIHRQGRLSFRDVITFNMDEYLGLSAAQPQSYHSFMRENFFRHIDIEEKNTHILNGETPDPEGECRAYEEAIAAAGGIDLFLGGMGEDGHIAFNEPFSSLSSRTRVKTLTESTRAANARFFGGDMNKVPSAALTVGVGTVMDAGELLIAASGRNKARALREAVEGGVSHRCPLSCIQNHPRAVVICDEDAAGELETGTVNYFRALEKPNLEKFTPGDFAREKAARDSL